MNEIKARKIPCPTVMRILVSYDENTGLFKWNKRPHCFFKSGRYSRESNANRWNALYAGLPSFQNHSRNGYLLGQIAKTNILSHRAAWAIYHGSWPLGHIDHINRNKADNRMSNLRDVSRSVNAFNRGDNANRGDMPKGVFKSTGGRWMARISYRGVAMHGGTFDTIELAAAKYAEMHERLTTSIGSDLPVVADMLAGELNP